MPEKICTRCKITFPLSDYAKDRNRSDGLHPHCRNCRRTYGTPYARERRKDPEWARRERNNLRKWRAANPDKCREYRQRAYSKRTPLDNKESFLKSKYGITLAEYEAMLSSQNGVCAICKRPERRKSRYGGVCRLHVDHCHETGVVRGLLCSRCNLAFDAFGTEERIAAALEYLRKSISYGRSCVQ